VSNIEGIPEGWELVRIGTPVCDADWIVDPNGDARLCDYESMYLNRVIIRKIEKPAKYRPFANAEEFKPHRDRWVRLKSIERSFYRLDGFGDGGVSIQGGAVDYGKMFEDHWFDDGTPFGVEVTQ
jgi:hypothetical protein